MKVNVSNTHFHETLDVLTNTTSSVLDSTITRSKHSSMYRRTDSCTAGTDTSITGTDTSITGTDTSITGTDTSITGTNTSITGTETCIGIVANPAYQSKGWVWFVYAQI